MNTIQFKKFEIPLNGQSRNIGPYHWNCELCGSKLAGRAAVYTHRNIAKVLEGLDGKQVHRAAEIPVYEFGTGFVDDVASILQRRDKIAVSVTERQLYLDVSGRTFSTSVVEHRFG